MIKKIFRQLLIVFIFLFLASIPANAQQCCEDECAIDKAQCESFAYSDRIFCEMNLGCTWLPYPERWFCENYCYNEYLNDLAICNAYVYQPCMNNCPCYIDGYCNQNPACLETHANCPNDCVCDNDGVCEPGETHANCPNDCYCDNNLSCDPNHGEDGGHGFTCYDCICDNDNHCEIGQGEDYTHCINDCYCVINGVCEVYHGENVANCADDCLTCQVCENNLNQCMQYVQVCPLYCGGDPGCLAACQQMATTCQNSYQACMAECQ